MFTGIIEEKGQVLKIDHVSTQAIHLTIQAEKILSDIEIGDSIAVNGVCLTVTSFSEESFQVDVMPETYNATSLSRLIDGATVNLERSLRADDRLGGHFVTGHVDGIGKIINKETCHNAIYCDIELQSSFIPYMISKGSVAIDGISLTVFRVSEADRSITISLIPHTVQATNLREKEVGDIVNIECDLLAKHVHAYLDHVKGGEK